MWKMKILASISVKTTFKFSFWISLGSFVQVICLFKEWVSYNLFFFGINGSWHCWKCSVLSFLLLHYAYLRCKNACIHPYVSCFCIIIFFFKKKHLTILLEGIKIFSDKITRKLPLVILIGWSLDIARYLEFTRPEKDPRLLAWHGKWEDPENGRA